MSKTIQFPVAEAGTQNVPVSEQKVQKETVIEYLKAYGYDKSFQFQNRTNLFKRHWQTISIRLSVRYTSLFTAKVKIVKSLSSQVIKTI